MLYTTQPYLPRQLPPRRPRRNPLLFIGIILSAILIDGFIIYQLVSFYAHRATSTPKISSPKTTLIQPTPTPVMPKFPPDYYNVRGKPSIDAQFIDRVLERNNSPAVGKGQMLYDYGAHYGIDPIYPLAFFLQESTFGTQGIAEITLSLGNIRATESDGYGHYQGYRQYKSWEEGFKDWYQLIATLYVAEWNFSTVDQIIPKYAPYADNNDEAAYIRNVKVAVDKWREEFKRLQ